MDSLQIPQLLSDLLARTLQLILAPQQNPDIAWIALPLLGTLFLMQAYFSRHNEPMDWNSAFGNGVALIFVAFDLMRHIYAAFPYQDAGLFLSPLYMPQTWVVLLLLAYSFFVMSITFFRTFPDYVAFTAASYSGTILLAYISIAVVYAGIPLDLATLLASLLLMAVAFVILSFTRKALGRTLARIFPTRGEREDHEIRTRKYDRKKFTWLEKGEV